MDAESAGTSLDRAIVVLRGVLAELEGAGGTGEQLRPWRNAASRPAGTLGSAGRVSATDQLSWWFRPAAGSDDPWDEFFLDEPAGAGADGSGWVPAGWVADPGANRPGAVRPTPEPPSARTSLQMLLSEPEEELTDDDAESVVTCLYDFVHALGRRDMESAMACVAPDYSTLEDDREIDAEGLAARLRALLDSLAGWQVEVFLVEIPQPVLHPAGILVPVEIQLDARYPATDARRTELHSRIAVFVQQPDSSWRIAALSAV
jgi:ketosteroid isomerase-like protein